MAAKTFKTALLQMCAAPDPAQNVAHASAMIRDAAGQGAMLICTPENTNLIQNNRDDYAQIVCEEKDDPSLKAFCALARETGRFLLIGSLAIKLNDTHSANRSFLIAPSGDITARYDKIHLFDVQINATEQWRESDHIRPGSKAVIADAGPAKLGFSICYDLRFAALYRALAKAGANVLTVPAAFTRVTGKAHWQTLLRARAIECGAYLLAPAQGGKHQGGRRTYGHSMIVDPWGEVVAHLDHDKPGILVADLDLDKCVAARNRIPALRHDRAFTGP